MDNFFSRIKPLLSSEEYEIFKNEYKKPAYRGVRANTLKCHRDKLLRLLTDELSADDTTPFCKDGFYLKEGSKLGGNHPLHHAGAIYFQEPSAMAVATVADVKKGEKVLDLCAAPGGKSTQLAAGMQSEGLLWCNEYVHSRANILLANIERCGVPNAVVSSASPEVLCENLYEFFDKVVVDAPCSGEGMFRRDSGAYSEWSVEHSKMCSVRQLKILESAKKSLKKGGELVYSTCTFSYDENEGVIEKFLRSNPDFELADCGGTFGRRSLSGNAVRIFPMDGGEGHFAAKLKKRGESYCDAKGSVCSPFDEKTQEIPRLVYDFLSESFFDTSFVQRLYIKNDSVYIIPENCPRLKGCGVIRAGVYVGTVKKNYFEPAHALYMCADTNSLRNKVDLSLDDDRVRKFLHGEEIPIDSGIKGYTAVLVEGIALGFGKAVLGTLKNKYPKGLRTLY